MITLTEAPESFTMESVHMQCIERFVVLMYSKTCSSATVNDARHHLFSNDSRSINSIPATQTALFEHVKRSLLQASFIWKQSITWHQEIPVFDKWGWEQDKHNKHWLPFWTTLADASKAFPSSCTVDAQNHAGRIVNAVGQAFVAHHCASARVAA